VEVDSADAGDRGERGGGEKERSKLIATEIMPLEEAALRRPRKTHILARTDSVKERTFDELKRILESHPGKSPVILHLIYPDKREVVVGLPDELSIEPREETFNEISSLTQGMEIRFTS